MIQFLVQLLQLSRWPHDIGDTGWIQIEGALPKGQPVVETHVQNVRFMHAHFS